MKKNLFYLFMLMVVAAMPLTSCEKDPQKEDEKQHQPGPKVEVDQEKITAYDALSWLQGSILVVNKDGEVIRRVYGKPLDESQPDVISVPVAGYGAAEIIFRSWVAPGKEIVKVDGGYDYMLTDDKGNDQGSVRFRAVDDEPGVIARMTVAEGTGLKQISEIRFIDHNIWPENAAYEKVEAGKIYYRDDYVLLWDWGLFSTDFIPEKKSLPFYCLQGNTDGKEGILVWLCPDTDDKWYHPNPEFYEQFALDKLPSESAAMKVLEFYKNNKSFWDKMLAEMDAKGFEWSAQDWGDATGRSEFLLNQRCMSDWDIPSIKCLDLDPDDIEINYVYIYSWYWYRYMHIEIIPALTE